MAEGSDAALLCGGCLWIKEQANQVKSEPGLQLTRYLRRDTRDN